MAGASRRPTLSRLHLFTSKRGPAIGAPLTVMGANIRIKETLEEYGVKTQNSSSHCLRKTFARRVYEANGRSEDALILLSPNSKPYRTRNDTEIHRTYPGGSGGGLYESLIKQ